MRRKAINELSASELEALSTRQLLARLKHLQQCEDSAFLSDRPNSERHIEFKDTAEWKTAYDQIKQVLAKREHVEKGIALVERRQRRAQQNRTAERRRGRKP